VSEAARAGAKPVGDDTQRRASIAAAAVAGIRRFALLPEVTLRIVDIVSKDSGDAADLHRAISTDPALCLRLLKVANSAFYGLPRPITSIDRAVVLLGGEAIRNIALAASLGRMISDGDGEFSARSLWRHSLAVAAAAQDVAKAVGSDDPGEAFLAGLLHDIGFMVQMQYDRKRLVQALTMAAAGDQPLVEIEDEIFGANHQDFGRELCRQWQLPESIGEVLWEHHEVTQPRDEPMMLAHVVRAAEGFAERCGLVFSGHAASDDFHFKSVATLGLREATLETIIGSLVEQTQELQRVLSR
jgi:putative nucleotidyltransferase with HDIG domain